MFNVSNRTHGLTITLEGLINKEDISALSFQLRSEWAGVSSPFIYVLDVQNFRYFTADAQALFEETLESAFEQGLVRISVLGVTTSLSGLFCAIMVRTGLMEIYQFLDLAYEEDPQTEMNTWLNEPFATQ